jgi:putative heme-binding domain-containing protein
MMRPLVFALSLFVFTAVATRAAEPFEIKEGDRVLLLGDALLERENTYGYLETRMQEQFPDRHFTVRNLSWSGETPRGWSRASFDSPDKGFERLKEDIAKVKPTVVFLGFGMAASLQELTDRSGDITLNPDPTRYGAEPMSAARFKKELGELMDAIGKDVRFVLLSPIRHEDLRKMKPGLPDPTEHNKLLEQYSLAIEELTKERGARFVDLEKGRWFTRQVVRPDGSHLGPYATDNGIHLHGDGYAELPNHVSSALGWDADKDLKDQSNTTWKGDGKALNLAVIQKNDLFFHQFRPANSTYLFGFRKHEQGQNAKEMPMFDPLIAAAEAEIDRLKAGEAGTPGSTRVPRVGSGVPPERTSTSAPATESVSSSAPDAKVREGGTPSPTRETRVLPGISGPIAGTLPPLPDFTVEDGYQIELWAQNPLLEKPTQMNWDPLGRLWVCSSSLYPQVEPGQAVDDKILILSDTNGDGVADKSEVFADGLLIPTGVVPDLVPGRVGVPPAGSGVSPERTSSNPGDAKSSATSPAPAQVREGGTPSPAGGTPTLPGIAPLTASACYVGQSTELLYLADTDGDGKADQKRVVFSGFGTEDTHHIVHTLHWGVDGRLYFHQSVYIHTHLETAWGMVRLNSGGVFAYDPRTEKVEVFAKGLWNTWGQQEDDYGQMFLTDGAGSNGISWAFPGAIIAPFEGSRRQMPSISPGAYPKFAGLELIKSPHFPADWQGNAITCDFRAHRIVRFGMTDLAAEPPASGRVGVPPAGSGVSPERTSGATADANSAGTLASSPQVREGGTPSPAGGTPTLPGTKSGFVTTEMPDLVRTTDLSFRPIDVRLGPDGALYVADWSNPVINHGEVDFRDPRRDHHMGRIWRITKKGAPAVKWEPLLGKKDGELLDKLVSPSAWEKEQARTTLTKSQPAETEMLATWFDSRRADYGKLGADRKKGAEKMKPAQLWTEMETALAYRELALLERSWGRVYGFAEADLMKNAEPGSRIAGIRLSSSSGQLQGSDEARRGLAGNASQINLWGLAGDPNPRVRLEAMRALARIPTATSAGLVLDAALKTPADDAHYDFAAWQSINDLAKPWTDAIASGEWKTEGKEAQLAYGLKSIDPGLASATLSRLFAAGKVPVDGTGPWIELIGDAGGPVELQRLLDGLLAGYVGDCCETDETRAIDNKLALTGPAADRAVAALLTAARVRGVKPAAHTELASALFHSPGEIGLGAIRLAGLWKTPDAVAKIGELLDSRETKPPLRRASVDGLKAAGGEPALALLQKLTASEEVPDTRAAALVAMVQVKTPAGIAKAMEVLPTLPEDALLGTWRGLLGVKGAADAFASKLSQPDATKALPAPVIEAALRAAREAGRPGAKLLAALAPSSGSANAPSTDYVGLAAQTKQNGDPAKGEMIYRRMTSACTTCHSIGGAGGKVGPDMTSIGASAPLDYIIESILNPNAKVKEGYNAVALSLADGTQATGIQARETASEIILRDAAGGEHGVPKAAVKSKLDIGSMMPAGLTATMQPREAIDLYAFLSQLGKPGAYDASKGHVARVWRMYPGAAAGEVVSATYDPAKNAGYPGYTLVDGRFVNDLLAEATAIAAAGSDTVLLAAQFQSSGKTRLTFTGAEKVWLDGQPLALGGEVAPDLANGTHTLVVKIGVKELPLFLRAESPDARFLGN